MAYKTIIGLEIHTELMTKTKMFCSCTNAFGGEANTHCCPVCLGLPGALPVINKVAIEYAIKSGIAFNCKINTHTRMDRKNYFYSDLVKGYQISQDDLPLCEGGYIEIESEEGTKKVHLERIHIEEDTGKQTHTTEGDTLIDYNRAGVPLIEIVTKPEMNTPEEARLFLENLRATLKYIEVSDCKMEEGSLRCDVNINIVDTETGNKTNITEIKNLNSFRGAVRAMEYEEKRHIELLQKGENTIKETRRWDEVKGETITMRTKGDVADYRYAADGDLAEIVIEDSRIEEIKNNLPELPHHKKERFISDYDLSEYDAGVLTASKELALFFEETIKYIDDSKLVSNWIMGDVLRRLKDEEIEIQDTKLTPKALGELINIVKDGKINNNTGKKVLKEIFDTGKEPETIIKEQGLVQISDEGALKEIVSKVLDENEQSIIDYKNGKDRAIGFLVGQIMKASKGKANPQMVNKMLIEMINER
ncbi:Asp-tRNA(Asn)/Glu-tRNA(Gln) amidotransferase subunit GatB [Tissierella sp. MB52-C2]|uniref:Asp-tRNA(Asn)/Glu-tRNA(Gln) amidotransferase subunit GatB n=1 Tax=Tissierella sp. MB52-C2 TaxID=3070999 RepID=UPI00280B7460|nr:Asp-tRNA(Asn)/Glu-tRNA(Gln) amidotransferase subunit GatB [Tissierella sp. MB52-C2]WMM23860.1 Asp-tRNA(Asn)/Glu-tRNA(Gln) amidotransferase subunit GatB [Tissierella sp. MB52-C2]